MRVLVLGATGYIGSRLVPHLLEHGHDVVAASSSPPRPDRFGWDDRVARRFTLRGMSRPVPPAEPVPVTLHGIAIDRLEHGRLVESWVQIGPYPRAD